MKKLIAVIAILLCLCLLNGCGTQAFLHDVAEHLVNANADAESDAAPDTPSDAEAPSTDGETGNSEPVSDSDAALTVDPVEETAAEEAMPGVPEEASAGTDFTALSLSDCVTDADGSAGKLPRITLDCPGAAAINEDIEGTFRYLVDADYCTLYYNATKNGSVLSILIAQLYDGDASYYTPYLLDLSTGERMSGYDLLGRMGLSGDDISAAELRIMGDEFEYQFGTFSEGDSAAFYEEQRERTVSADNADLNRLWLSEWGELQFVAKIFSMAGTEFMEYPMGTGYYF